VPNQSSDSAETQELLIGVRAGKRRAFEDLFDRHRERLHQAIQLRLDPRMRARIDASDVVQEAQLEAFRRLDDYLERQPMPFGLWLRKMAQERLSNERRRHLQAKKRSVDREQPFPEQSSMMIAAPFLQPGVSASSRYAKREYGRLVAEAVMQLDEVDREILLMRNVEGLSHRDIAQILDVSYDSVRQRYGRALVKLRRLLAERGVSESQS
jgi:RNA polymerase sigma-70 factor (ECF subfamily)